MVEEIDTPCYSVRLLKPFMTILEAEGRLPRAVKSWLSSLGPDERVHVTAVHAMLEVAAALSNDALLGVKASKLSSFGDAGLLDFVMSSADDLRAALAAAQRYMRLQTAAATHMNPIHRLNDACDLELDVEGERAVVRLDYRVPLPAIAEDYQICGLIMSQAHAWPEGMLEELDVWFRHEAPSDLSTYHEVLAPARLHFRASSSGFGFPNRLLDAPLRSRNAKLHDVLRRCADRSLARLPKPASLTERVKRLVASQLATRDFSMEVAARTLHMSPRTLGRRLADERTTFTNIIDEARRSIALHHVAVHDIGLSEVALLVGFPETPSFYRAFRRWTGGTPSQYRRKHRGDLRGLR